VFFLAVDRWRRGVMDELRGSSGELVGMMGGSAITAIGQFFLSVFSPPFSFKYREKS